MSQAVIRSQYIPLFRIPLLQRVRKEGQQHFHFYSNQKGSEPRFTPLIGVLLLAKVSLQQTLETSAVTYATESALESSDQILLYHE